ncbi:MAG: hypothetical protein IKU94_06790 [Bacteroidaceae bacterium]|nr:hypothetical protein [Bacteroidaceae bacterium]
MFVGYGKHPFLIVLRLQTQGIELAIATRSVGDFKALRLALQGHPFGVGERPQKMVIYMSRKTHYCNKVET